MVLLLRKDYQFRWEVQFLPATGASRTSSISDCNRWCRDRVSCLELAACQDIYGRCRKCLSWLSVWWILGTYIYYGWTVQFLVANITGGIHRGCDNYSFLAYWSTRSMASSTPQPRLSDSFQALGTSPGDPDPYWYQHPLAFSARLLRLPLAAERAFIRYSCLSSPNGYGFYYQRMARD